MNAYSTVYKIIFLFFVAVPTGTLGCTYRQQYEGSVTCGTLHSLFKFSGSDNETPQINWSIAMFGVIFIDEVSQVSVLMFHHIISTIERVIRCLIVIMCSDFAQQQPIATVNAHATQEDNITSCTHCMLYVNKLTLTTQPSQ